jgi:hypothetical protein
MAVPDRSFDKVGYRARSERIHSANSANNDGERSHPGNIRPRAAGFMTL